jgi:hypothetical protein
MDGSNELELLDEREDPIDKLVTCGIGKDEVTEPKLLEAIPVEPSKGEAKKVEPSESKLETAYVEPGRLELELERIPGDPETTSAIVLIELDVSPNHCEVGGDSDRPPSREFEIAPSELGEFELEAVPVEIGEPQAGLIKPNELELRLVTCELKEAPIEPLTRVVEISCIELSEFKLELEPTPEPDSGTPPIELEAKALVTAFEGLDTYPVTCKVEGGPVELEGSAVEIMPVELNELELELNPCELEAALDETGKLELGRATCEAKSVKLRVLESKLLTGCEVGASPSEVRVLKLELPTACEVKAKPAELRVLESKLLTGCEVKARPAELRVLELELPTVCDIDMSSIEPVELLISWDVHKTPVELRELELGLFAADDVELSSIKLIESLVSWDVPMTLVEFRRLGTCRVEAGKDTISELLETA